MDKIFRWTIGDCSPIGISILEKSIQQAKKIFKDFNFKFFVCLNSNSPTVEKICLKHKIELINPKWESFPLPKEIIPEDCDLRSPHGIPRGRQGSFWKLCPPRISINSHEIVCDNDLIFNKCPKEIKNFLDSERTLVTEENIFSFGKYKKHISKPYNSGLYGLPPNYDFTKKIIETWKKTGQMQPLLSRDEQGIILLTLLSNGNYIEIPKEKTCFVFNDGEAELVEYQNIKENTFDSYIVKNIKFRKSKLDKDMIHFLGANRNTKHSYWNAYRTKFL